MINLSSPALAFVGRHNSGKTTLIEKLIVELVGRGLDVGSVKHHTHVGFDIDQPGKDSYRHRAAGTSETVIASPDQMARIQTITHEIECADIVASMPNHDIVLVEGYRYSGLPTVEIMRAANERDVKVATEFVANARAGHPLGFGADAQNSKLPTAQTVAFVTDIADVAETALSYGLRVFGFDDLQDIADFTQKHYARPKVTVVIQAGGESKRMGQSKALVEFLGRPLICRLIERVSPAANELIITTNEADKLAFVHEMYPDLHIRLVPDEMNFRGALPGLYTALNAASNAYVALVACDMVYAGANLIAGESYKMRSTYADIVIPINKHGFEPFHAMYYKKHCLPAIKRALDAGQTKAQSFFDDVEVCEFSMAEVLHYEPRGGCFINANTPDELHAIEYQLTRFSKEV